MRCVYYYTMYEKYTTWFCTKKWKKKNSQYFFLISIFRVRMRLNSQALGVNLGITQHLNKHMIFSFENIINIFFLKFLSKYLLVLFTTSTSAWVIKNIISSSYEMAEISHWYIYRAEKKSKVVKLCVEVVKEGHVAYIPGIHRMMHV